MAARRETIVDRIRMDHRTVIERIRVLEERARGERGDAREPVFLPMRTDLLAHMVAEEEYVYLLLEHSMRQWIENSMREHGRIREHLSVLAAGGTPAAAWLDRLREMKRLLEEHIVEEERAVLPHLEMTYDLERLRDLGDEYARRMSGRT